MFTVDIDTGGTFTDGLFSDGKRVVWTKVDTTEHDLTIAFNNCLQLGSQKLGFDNVSEFLEAVDMIRWSSTIASNVLAQRNGPRLGLFVVSGHEDTLYSSMNPDPSIGFLIERSNIIGLSQPVSIDEVQKEVKALLERGVRRICVSFKDSFYDNEEEQLIKKTIAEQYPEHYLSSIPVLTGEEICKHPDDSTRTRAALLNAYVHGPMASSLFTLEDDLRNNYYLRPLLIGHINGGVAKVSKTTPINTVESGAIFGIHGGAYFANVYGLGKVMTLDVGGTTTKIGLISDGKPVTSHTNDIFGIPLKLPLMDLHSIALGGGTVARARTGSDTTIELGPKSMGSYPGPACYDLGGTEATLTDALLALKYFDPDYFAGGTRKLNVAKAEEAIRVQVANSTGANLSAAASRIMNQAITMIAENIGEVCDKKEIDPKDFSLFAFGGNGGILGCYVAERIGINRVYIFSVSAVFSAFGSSTADISHTYEHAPFTPLENFNKLKEIVSGLQEEALRDMKGEGLDLDEVQLGLTFEISDGENSPFPVETAYLEFDSVNNVKQVRDLFDKVAPQGYARDKLMVELVTLKAWCTTSRYEPPVFEIENSDSTGAVKGEREIIWNGDSALTPIYDWNLLKSGNVLAGPAIVESNDISYLVPIGWTMTVDQYKNALIDRGE